MTRGQRQRGGSPLRRAPGGEAQLDYDSGRQRDRESKRCARLRYVSGRGGLVLPGRGAIARLLERFDPCRSPRLEPWYPRVLVPRLDATV